MFTTACRNDCLFLPRVFEWHKRFNEGHDSGRPSISRTDEIQVKISEIIQKDRQLYVRMIAEFVNNDKGTTRKIQHEDLNTMAVSAKMIPRVHTLEQKERGKECCVVVLNVAFSSNMMQIQISFRKYSHVMRPGSSSTILNPKDSQCTGKHGRQQV